MDLNIRARLVASSFALLGLLVFGNVASTRGLAVPQPRTVAAASASVSALPYRVLDAEYSRALDRIVMVSEAPNRLSIYDPSSHGSVNVGLPRVPRNVSVSPDGHYAAVGHDALISYVDLRQGVLVKTLDLTADPADIVLAGNGKVYVAPARDQWVQLHAVDIATNVEQLGSMFYAGMRIKMHPNGQSLYGADRGLSPADIQKLNISVHPPASLYGSPYHGEYLMGGDLWLSEDGLRIFTACGNVFRASATQSQDMTYNGNLQGAGIGSIGHLSHSQAANKILVVPQRRDYFSGCYGSSTPPDT
jgi:chitinase